MTKPLGYATDPLNKVLARCAYCGRPALYWGGKTCDECDSDNSGVNDRDEPIGTDKPIKHSLFDAPSKGFEVVAFNMERPLASDPRYFKLYRRRAQRNLPL